MELSLDIIYDSEPEQAAAHVLAYFRQEFAKPLPPPKSLLRDEKALMEQIDAAFVPWKAPRGCLTSSALRICS